MSILLIDAKEVTGPDKNYFAVDSAKSHTLEVFFTNTGGGVTVLTVALEGGFDGTNFVELARHSFTPAELTAARAMFHVSDRLVDYVRANIITLTETGTTAVSARWQGR